MARALWKGPYTGVKFLTAQKQKILGSGKEKRKLDALTYSRSAVILKEWIGLNIGVHNGKNFLPVFIIPPMVGQKLGEFSRTRVKPVHPKKTTKSIDRKSDSKSKKAAGS